MLDQNLKNNLDMEFKYNLPAGKTIAVFDIITSPVTNGHLLYPLVTGF